MLRLYESKREMLIRLVKEEVQRLDARLHATLRHAGIRDKAKQRDALPGDLEAFTAKVRRTDVEQDIKQLDRLRSTAEGSVRGQTCMPAGIKRMFHLDARIDDLIYRHFKDTEKNLALLQGPRQQLVNLVYGPKKPWRDLENAVTEANRMQRTRAARWEQLLLKLALDNDSYLAALPRDVATQCVGTEDACDARIATWYEAELDFVDAEKERQEIFLTKLLQTLRSLQSFPAREAVHRLHDACEAHDAICDAVRKRRRHYRDVSELLGTHQRDAGVAASPGVELPIRTVQDHLEGRQKESLAVEKAVV
jgi:hypothetical protein